MLGGERRVAATPDTVKKLVKWGYSVVIESGAGAGATIDDAAYVAAGATIDPDGDNAWGSDVVFKVNAPGPHGEDGHEVDRLKEGATIVSLVFPVGKEDLLSRYAAKKITALALDQVPRISRGVVGPFWFPGMTLPESAPAPARNALVLHLSTEVLGADVHRSLHRDPWVAPRPGEVLPDGVGLFRERRFAVSPGSVDAMKDWARGRGAAAEVVELVPGAG